MQRHSSPSVREFMGKDVLAVYQDSLVSKAVSAMVRRNVGSVVVLDVLGPCGVFTERDLLSKVLGSGKDPESTVLGEVTSPMFPATDVDADLESTAEMMVKRRSRLMVFEGADLVGMVTPTDIVRMLARINYDFPVEGVLSREVASVFPETPVDVVVKVMSAQRIGSVLVSVDDSPSAIFTERDLLSRVVAGGRRLGNPVSEFASSPVVTAELGTLGRGAASVMVERRIKRLPLTRGDSVKAMVTARDLVEAFSESGRRRAPRIDWAQWN